MEIRAYQSNDFEPVYQLFKNELGYEENKQHIEEMLKSHFEIFVAVIDQQVVGFIGIELTYVFEINNKVIRIIALAVDTKYQRQGIGRQLICYIETLDVSATILTLNNGLKRKLVHCFYTHLGFMIKGYSFIKKNRERMITCLI